MVASLRGKANNVRESLLDLSPHYENVSLKNIGGTLVSIKTPMESELARLLTGFPPHVGVGPFPSSKPSGYL